MGFLFMKEFPYYPTDYTWRRKEFNQFLQYQDSLWENKDIKQTMHGLALCWSYMPHSWAVQCKGMNSPLQTFENDIEKVLKKMVLWMVLASPWCAFPSFCNLS